MDDGYFYALLLLIPLLTLGFMGYAVKNYTKECIRCAHRIPKNASLCTKCGTDQPASH